MAFVKWIGAFLGRILGGGIFGAIAGYALGNLIDNAIDGNGDTPRVGNGSSGSYSQTGGQSGSYSQSGTQRTREEEGQRNSFLISLLMLAAHIVQADGKIMHSEMELVRQFLRTNFGADAETQGNQIMLRLFDLRKQKGETEWNRQIQMACRELSAVFTLEQRLQLIAFLCDIAKADGHVDQTELDQLHRVAGYLGLNASEVDQLLHLGGQTLEEAYKVLGVSPDATDDEVKRAYRKMALQYHPDKVATLGEDVKAAAEKKFKEIGAAKDLIWEARGL